MVKTIKKDTQIYKDVVAFHKAQVALKDAKDIVKNAENKLLDHQSLDTDTEYVFEIQDGVFLSMRLSKDFKTKAIIKASKHQEPDGEILKEMDK